LPVASVAIIGRATGLPKNPGCTCYDGLVGFHYM
jgi:hypothetical protein